MPSYRKHGKILTPLSNEDFLEGMKNGRFLKPKHRAFVAELHYSGVRCSEALRAKKEQYKLVKGEILFDVLKRLKHGKHTPPLHIPLNLPYANEIWQAVENTKQGERVFPYCRKTGYNIVSRVFKYPHWHRLTRITDFFQKGFTIPEVRTWTGLTLNALEPYIGIVKVEKMGKALGEDKK